jgi:hypothetical protein
MASNSYVVTGTRGRKHLVPDVASDTFALLGAAQTISGVHTFSATPVFTAGATLTGTSNVNLTDTITSATPSTRRAVYSKITLTPSTTQAVGSGGSLCAVRGEINQTTGKTFTDGFLYGVQGKNIFAGTLAEASAARLTGVLGQTDISGCTLTAGQVSAVWADLQGTSPTLTVNDQVYVLRVTNSMNVSAQAFQLNYGKADYYVEASADGGTADWFAAAGSGGTSSAGYAAGAGVPAKVLKCRIMGVDYWLPLYSSNA